MIEERDILQHPASTSEGGESWLQDELDEAHKTIRNLLRQLSKEQAHHGEITRAYNIVVAKLVEVAHENAALERERDRWKKRAEGAPNRSSASLPELTPAEVGAIRKAMARLHHPDAGGDSERMKAWNAILDALER